MTLRLQRIVLFVADLDGQTDYYRDLLQLPVLDLRKGWAEFGNGDCTIALHRGTGRKPRLEFVCTAGLERSREDLIARGAKLGEIKSLNGLRFCRGKDRDGNQIQLSEGSDGPA